MEPYDSRQMELTVHREAALPGTGFVLVGGREIGRVFRAPHGTEGHWFYIQHGGSGQDPWASRRRNFKALEEDLLRGWAGGEAVRDDFWVWLVVPGRSYRLMHGRIPLGYIERVGDDRRWRARYDGHRENVLEDQWFWTVGETLEALRSSIARAFGMENYQDVRKAIRDGEIDADLEYAHATE